MRKLCIFTLIFLLMTIFIYSSYQGVNNDLKMNTFGGVCIPGLGCFSGLEGYFTGIGTAWFNPGFLYSYHSILEKNAVGFEFVERFPRTDRWVYVHHSVGKNYIGVALNRTPYKGFLPFDTTYFHPRGEQIQTLIVHLRDSLTAPSYLIDLLWATSGFGGGVGFNLHAATRGSDHQYTNLFESAIKLNEDIYSFGGKVGLDNKNIFTVLAFDYMSSSNKYELTDTFNNTDNVNFNFSTWQVMGDFKYKIWIDDFKYITFPHISLNVQTGKEEFMITENSGISFNPDNSKQSYSMSIGSGIDRINILQSLSVGLDLSFTKTTEEYNVDTMVVLANGDSIVVTMPGRAEVQDISFPSIFIATKCRIWKWFAANSSISYIVTYSTKNIDEPTLLWVNPNDPPNVVTHEKNLKDITSEITFDIGAEINVTDAIIVEVKFTDRIFYNSPYMLSGASTIAYITNISARYEF